MEWEGNILELVDEFKDVLSRLKAKKERLDQHRPIAGSLLQKIQRDLSLEWSYNSNSIEGNSITLKETAMVLKEGVTVKGKSLREHFEIHNHDKAIGLLIQLVDSKGSLNVNALFSLHSMILRSIEDDWAGRYRTGGVRIVGANFVPPNPLRVSEMMDELMEYIKKNEDGLDVLLLATLFHHRFVWVHPFADGNGRTVRLAMNMLLMQAGYPPAIILATDRVKYYDALNQANNGRFNKLLTLMLQAVERSLNIYLGAMPGNGYDYQLISDVVKEPSIPYGQEYVSLLARQGKIDAYKEGRNWLTTEQAVLNYMHK